MAFEGKVQTSKILDKRELEGPFDVIGDVHGCADELTEHLAKLGYTKSEEGFAHPTRVAIFVGDLVDKGPKPVETLKIVMAMVRLGSAYCVRGNHEDRLLRYYSGGHVDMTREAFTTIAAIDQHSQESKGFHSQVKAFLQSLRYYGLFDKGRLLVAHAGLPTTLIGTHEAPARQFALHGFVGSKAEDRTARTLAWQHEHSPESGISIVFGHTPTVRPRVINGTVGVDGGCAVGGSLTSIEYVSGRPLAESAITATPARALYAPWAAWQAGNSRDAVSTESAVGL